MTMRTTVLGTGLNMPEGPTFMQSGRVVTTSIGHGRVYGGTLADGVDILVETGGGANGSTEGPDGVVYVAQNGVRYSNPEGTTELQFFGASEDATGGVQAIDPDGSLRYVTDLPTSPNDLCFGPDGYLYVTDPTRKPERDDGRIWRVDVSSGEAELLVTVDWYPNGIGFGPADDLLYVADTRHRRMVTYELTENGLGKLDTLFMVQTGAPDGFAFDTEGRIVLCAPHGSPSVQWWTLDGSYVDGIDPGPGDFYTNVAVDGDGTMLISDTGGGRLLAVEGRSAPGLALHPFR
jgi:gluconolactonase